MQRFELSLPCGRLCMRIYFPCQLDELRQIFGPRDCREIFADICARGGSRLCLEEDGGASVACATQMELTSGELATFCNVLASVALTRAPAEGGLGRFRACAYYHGASLFARLESTALAPRECHSIIIEKEIAPDHLGRELLLLAAEPLFQFAKRAGAVLGFSVSGSPERPFVSAAPRVLRFSAADIVKIVDAARASI